MKRIISVLALTLGMMLLIQCSRNTAPLKADQQTIDDNQGVSLSATEKELVAAVKPFGFELFQSLNTETPDKNVILSPFSVSMALGMTLNGAANATYDSMSAVLGFEGMDNQTINETYRALIEKLTTADAKVLFEIVNSIWYRNGFYVLPEFIEANRTYFDALVQAGNFDQGTLDSINTWVNEKTHGKIENILDYIDPRDVMYLINAIYFKATWMYQFDKEQTTDDMFYLEDGSKTICKMMTIRENWNYYHDDQIQAVEMPYGDGKFSMIIILPNAGFTASQIIAGLDQQRWAEITSHFAPDSGTIKLPKFKLRFEDVMNDDLKKMGMGIAFNGMQADFSRLNPQTQLFISLVLHKTFIQVDEEGTEAAAVTLVGIRETSIGDEPEEFFMYVNKPFIFVIRERANDAILFLGKVTKPEWEE